MRDAIVDTTMTLVAEHGFSSVTMSQVAAETGIGRATLYKYFPDVDAILSAWHERQITAHLSQLVELRDRHGSAAQRLEAVLGAYAFIAYESRGHADNELAALLHRDAQVARAQKQLHKLIRDLIAETQHAGDVRTDIAADELAVFCLHALTAAGQLQSKAAVERVVAVALSGLQLPS